MKIKITKGGIRKFGPRVGDSMGRLPGLVIDISLKGFSVHLIQNGVAKRLF